MSFFNHISQKERAYLGSLNIPLLKQEKFSMTIDDIFTIVGKGTVVKNNSYSICLKICIICLIISLIPVKTFALTDVSGGFAAINNYSYCGYENRAGVNYVNELEEILKVAAANPGINYSTSYKYLNAAANKQKVQNSGRVTLFAYAGHGLKIDTSNNALHFNEPYSSVSNKNHAKIDSNGENSYLINLRTTETKFNHKYVVLYTCNQLADQGIAAKKENILKMMNGTRLILGFASTMYLDSREGRYFGSMLGEDTIIDAYITAVKYYQPQKPDKKDTIARNYAPSYKSSPSSFGILNTTTIACNRKDL